MFKQKVKAVFRLLVKKNIPNNIGTNNEPNRQEWLFRTLKAIPNGLRILDAGAGELQNKKYCTHLNYVSQDFCQYDGLGDNKGCQMESWDTSKIDIVGDIENIDEKDSSFDVILCSEVFEHLPNPINALNEFNRLLKKGGTLILTAPFCSLTHFSPYHYSTGFNRYFYEYHLEKLEFKISELSANGNYFEYIAQEIRRLRSVSNIYCAKESIFRRIVYKVILAIPVVTILKILEIFSKLDTNSSELLCYGYHVIAVKK